MQDGSASTTIHRIFARIGDCVGRLDPAHASALAAEIQVRAAAQ
jgi:hypothetical protein